MSLWFLGVITTLWFCATFGAIIEGQWGNAIMYAGFVVAQLGMIINAIHT